MLFKICPSFLKQYLINMNEFNGHTFQNIGANLDRFLMVTTVVKKGDRFIKNIGSSDNHRKIF